MLEAFLQFLSKSLVEMLVTSLSTALLLLGRPLEEIEQIVMSSDAILFELVRRICFWTPDDFEEHRMPPDSLSSFARALVILPEHSSTWTVTFSLLIFYCLEDPRFITVDQKSFSLKLHNQHKINGYEQSLSWKQWKVEVQMKIQKMQSMIRAKPKHKITCNGLKTSLKS